MESLPVLDYPNFLSPPISHYLKQIADEATRNLVFVDKHKMEMPFYGKAALVAFVDRCDVLLCVNPNDINEHNYQAGRDDPILAHEITHLQLLHDGWARIQGRQLDQTAQDKIRMVENFLTDPIVNRRIAERGFSLKQYVTDEAEAFAQNLRAGREIAQGLALIPGFPTAGVNMDQAGIAQFAEIRSRIGSAEPIGRFMALYLDPELPEATRLTLYDAFRMGLPGLFEIAHQLIKCVKENGFDDPNKYQQAALSCLQIWGVDTQQVQFVEFKACIDDGSR